MGDVGQYERIQRKERTVELAKFKELEEKIKNILNEYNVLKKKNQELEGRLKNTSLELEGAKDRLKELQEEKDGIHARVDSLLNLLQDIDVNVK